MNDDVAAHARSPGAGLVPGLLSPELARVLAFQISAVVAQNTRHFLKAPTIGARPCYEGHDNDIPLLKTFLWGMTPRIGQEVGVALLPTYCYFRTYQHGDVCRVHVDRPACEHSLSLTVAYSDDLPWALAVGCEEAAPEARVTRRGDADFAGERYVEFPMQAGDGVVYRGDRYRHGRVSPNPNRWSLHLFMHWVERGGRHAGQAFDGQSLDGQVDFTFP